MLSYDVEKNYLYKTEMIWMLASNALYYLIAISLAFGLKDRRAFCKLICPVALIMKVPASVSKIKIKPSGSKCIKCGQCNKVCPMDVDVMSYISRGVKVSDTECVLCAECKNTCPANAIG